MKPSESFELFGKRLYNNSEAARWIIELAEADRDLETEDSHKKFIDAVYALKDNADTFARETCALSVEADREHA